MGFPDEEARQAVRFSFGWDTLTGDGERAAHAVADVVDAMVAR
jgi:cysteine sulfinate desulfinase/cysteine desulfurase-like protein